MSYSIRVVDHAAQPALVVKGKTPVEQAGEAIGANIGAVSAFLEKAQLSPAGAPFTRTHSFENGVLEFEAGFPVARAAKTQGQLIATELPQTKAATTVHVGDQATSENAYAALHAWMKANGKKPAGAPWEVYVADDKMEIYFPIC
jgi:effector-binding domain-containing protein